MVSHATSTAKPSVPSLPAEIVNRIIFHAVNSPSDHMHIIRKCKAAASSLFSNPWMRVSRHFRDQYLQAVSTQHVWIRLRIRYIKYNSPGDWANRFEILKDSLPAVPESRLPTFNGMWSIIELESHPLDQPWNSEISVMFPFNFVSFCRVLCFVGSRDLRPRCRFSISTSDYRSHMIEFLQNRIVPMLLLKIYAGWELVFDLPTVAMPSDEDVKRVTQRHRSIREDLGVITRYIDFVNRLEAEGCKAESGFWILYYTWIFSYLESRYTFQTEFGYDWSRGATSPDVPSLEYGSQSHWWSLQQHRNVIGNEISDALNALLCRSAESIVFFWGRFGLEWFDDNVHLLPILWSSAKVFGGHAFELFPLSTEQLAYRIFIRRFPAQIIQAYRQVERARKTNSQDLDLMITKFGFLPSDTEPCDRFITATVVTHLMQPANKEYAQAFAELSNGSKMKRVKQEMMLRRKTIVHIHDHAGNEMWIGPQEMLPKFSTTRTLDSTYIRNRQDELRLRDSGEEAIRAYRFEALERLPRPIDPHEMRRIGS